VFSIPSAVGVTSGLPPWCQTCLADHQSILQSISLAISLAISQSISQSISQTVGREQEALLVLFPTSFLKHKHI
jgi:hypothetical protein